jgi:1,4-dihydroxy-2-naphthoate octaprenyltransferase
VSQTIHPLIIAARPKTLTAALSPVLVGISLAWVSVDSSRGLSPDYSSMAVFSFLTAFTAILIQILTNYVNDLWDFRKGSDTKMRTGPKRVLLSGMMTEKKMEQAIYILTGLILVPGSALVYQGGYPILVIGLLSIAGAYAYTAGPYPLAHKGLGEIFVLIFFGPVAVMGTEYVLIHKTSTAGFLLGISCGLLATSLLLINNTRDITEDRASGKLTLAARYGRTFANLEMAVCLFLPQLLVYSVSCLYEQKNYIAFTCVTVIPALIIYIKFIRAERGDDFNRLLPLSGMNLFLFSLILSFLILI